MLRGRWRGREEVPIEHPVVWANHQPVSDVIKRVGSNPHGSSPAVRPFERDGSKWGAERIRVRN